MNPMILTKAECERVTVVPHKTTAIMATCQSKIECLMWSVFSLLLRSTKALEHIIVVINGPDKRTGDPTLQDTKQAFLEELRNTRWLVPSLCHDRDMPITIIRAWSRIGHSQALDTAIPWVHTEAYTIMHDDIIVNTSEWCNQTFSLLTKNVGMVYAPPLLATGLSTVDFGESKKINLPHPNSVFITSRKELYTDFGFRWYGYHIKKDFELTEDEFLRFHKEDTTHVPAKGKYGYLSMDVGTWPYYRLKEAGYEFEALHPDTITHLCAMSWRSQGEQKEAVSHNKARIDALVAEIYQHEHFKRLYEKYMT